MATPTPVALRAASFLGTIGVNTHISWQDGGSAYADQTNIKEALSYLGVQHVRDGVPYEGWTLPFYQELAASGIKFDLITSSDEFNKTGDFSTDLARMEALAKSNPGSIAAIEGLNEINTWTVDYKGQNTGSNLAIGAEVQALLYKQADTYAALKDVPVLNLTVGGLTGQQASVMGNMDAVSDYGTWHVYFGNGDQPNTNVASGVAAAKLLNPSDPVQITEANYYTAVDAMEWGGGGVTEAVQAKLDLNLLMDAAKAGVARTYLYELFDNGLSPASTVEGSLGLFRSDGTPKAAATAIHNLTAILSDKAANASTFATGGLDFTVSGLPSTGKTLLLQEADGAYDLVIWAEPDIWNEATRTAVAAPGSQVTVTLGQAAGAISVYDPLTGTAPIASAKNTNSIAVTVTDHPLILEIAGPAAAPSAPAANLNLEGTANGDSLAGGAGADRLRGLAGNDTLSGGGGNDALNGGADADILGGGAGNDYLLGGRGSDTLTGGAGPDRFAYLSASEGGDTIADFNVGEGDRLDLRGVFATAGQNYAKLSTGGFVKAAAVSDGVLVSVDGDGGGDGYVALAKLNGLTMATLGGDFLIA